MSHLVARSSGINMSIVESIIVYILFCVVVGIFIGKFIAFGMGSDDEK